MLRQLQQGIRVRSSVWNGIEFAACSGCTGHHQSRGIRLFEVYCVVNNRLWLIVSV